MNILRNLHEMAICLRNKFYDYGVLDKVTLPVPVVSIGNITAGGTGKTPVVQLVAEYLKAKGKNPLVVSLNYKAEVKTPHRVNPWVPRASYLYGDEPVLLAKKLSPIPVWVGPIKRQTARVGQSIELSGSVVVDDGFQHRSLKRDMDIVLLDCSMPFSDHELIPVGRGRETFGSLERANWIILSKFNLAEVGTVDLLNHRIPKGKKVLELHYNLMINEDQRVLKSFVLTGIGNPEAFVRSLKQRGVNIVGEKFYEDHHRYTLDEILLDIELAKKAGAEQVLVTEKDYVKIESLMQFHKMEISFISSVALVPQLVGPVEEFYSELGNLGH